MAAAVESAIIAPDPPAGHKVLSVRHYEATPPANINQGLIDGDVIATTKEEEWVTKKKVELTTTRQIETRVQRQLVLEDGKVVEDSGPIVSTNTTEDTEKQEHEHTEHRTTGDDPPGEGWLAIPMEGEGAVVKEVRERVVHSKEETEELTETEDVKHQGDLTDNAYLESVRSNQDVRLALRAGSGGHDSPSPVQHLQGVDEGVVSVTEGPRIVHQSRRSRRIVDTDDTQELSRVQNGHVVTETRRTTEHEEERGERVPEEEGATSEEEHETNHREGTHRYAHTKEQDLVQYIGSGGRKIAEHMRYSAENVEGGNEGDPDPEWESLSTRMQRMRKHQPGPAAVGSPLADPTSAESAAAAARKDALTKRPLDFDQEEETRKVETSKWLEHHFGSDSRSSKSSIDDEHVTTPSGAHFINVTMKSRPINGASANVLRATPSPRPISPVVNKPVPAVFTPARVFLSSPEPSNEPISFVNTPPPPPAPVLPATPGRLVNGINGRQNSSSSGGSGPVGYFQGVTEWSERRTVNGTSNMNGRQDRIQVLPTGPGHTFNSSSVQNNRVNGVTSFNASSRVNGSTSPPNVFNRVSSPSTLHQSSRLNGASSPMASINSSTRLNGTTSPPPPLTTQHRLNGSVSPRPISPPQGYREEVEEDWRGRPTSPVRHHRSYHAERRGSAELLQSERVFSESRSERRGSADLLRGERRGIERRGSSELLQRRYSSPPREIIEPPPDYSPGRRRRSRHSNSPSPSPPPNGHSRKSNQKTRFADPPPQKTKSSFGDSLRRFVGKFRSSDDKKQKRKSLSTTSPSRSYRHQGSENNNIPSSANRRLRVGRGESPPNEAVRRGSAEDEEEVYSDEEEGGVTSSLPVPPPRVRQRQHSPSHHHQLASRLRRENMMEPRRFYLGEDPFGGSIYGREKEYDGVTPPARSSRNGRHHSNRSRRGSQEDQGASSQGRNVVWHEEVRSGASRSSPLQHHPVTATVSNTSTLGRYSRSAGRLHSQFDEGGAPRSTQTLPRKLSARDEPGSSSRVITTTTTRSAVAHTPVTRSASHWESSSSGSRLTRNQPNTGSLINVSIVNNVTPSSITGPAKPARTYRSSLARSQSFNVTANEAPPPRRLFQQQQPKTSSYYRSNPHIHRLEEASSPLKSPGIISSISRSQRDLSEAVNREALIEEEESRFAPRVGSRSPSGLNGTGITSSLHESKKKLFMKGLLDRAPELYRTLHGEEAGPVSPNAPNATNTQHRVEYSNSFRGSESLTPGVRPARTRRSTTSPPGSLLTPSPLHNGDTKTMLSPSQSFRSQTSNNGKDYSETVCFTSTSDDPLRPSVTNTVQSFSKKTVASPRPSGGVATETIESKETTTVTKSRIRDPQYVSSYPNNAITGKNKFSYDQPIRNGGVVIEVRNNK